MSVVVNEEIGFSEVQTLRVILYIHLEEKFSGAIFWGRDLEVLYSCPDDF